MAALAEGMARMVEVAGIAHVGLGSDMMGLLSPAAFSSYAQLPDLAAALLAQGFSAEETAKLLGGNAARVFAATLACRPPSTTRHSAAEIGRASCRERVRQYVLYSGVAVSLKK